ncbi:hypothetical protein [Candidatus Endomicrobiellum agilis]|nr:hypothetical protein [Endomicrobium sp.]
MFFDDLYKSAKKAISLFLIMVLISGCGKPLNNAKSEVANNCRSKA